MHAFSAGNALERLSGVDDLGGVRVCVVGLAQVRDLCHGAVERHLGVVGDHLRDLLRDEDGVVQHARGVVDSLLGLHLAVGDDVGDLLRAVDVPHVLDDLQPSLIVEVHIDIGHLRSLWRKEALEDEVVFQRVEGGDVKRIRDDGARRRAAARPHADALLLGPARELLHDEEVRGEALAADDVVLVLETLDHVFWQGVAVALLEAGDGLLAQHGFVGFARRQGEARQDDLAELQRDVALVCDLERGLQAFRVLAQGLCHLLRRLHVELVVGELHAVFVCQVLAHADAQHEVLGVGVFALEVVEVVGAHRLQAHLVGEAGEDVVEARLRDAVVRDDLWALVLQLDVEVLAPEDVDEGLGPLLGDVVLAAVDGLGDDAGDTGAGGQDAVVEPAQALERDAGLVVEAVHRGVRDDAHEVAVALVGLGQQDHVVELRFAVLAQLAVWREVDLAAQDGLDAHRGGRLVELRAAVHVAVVCDGHGGHA